MQRTRRRLLCSAGSVSSPSDCTIRPRRRRTSSAGGDCSAISEDIKKFDEPSPQSRSSKHHMRLRASKRASKAGKFVKPTFGSLQNTIVLAPFHTLKKCFQSKLVDLYSHEKMKKFNHKKRMAKNTSFEYDVIELKPLGQNFKKEGKTGKSSQREKHEKKKRSRSQSYCQCRKPKSEMGHKNLKEIRKLRTRSSLRRDSDYLHPSNKRRRLSNHPLTSSALKTELGGRHASKDMIYGRRSDLSVSGLSSRSKVESWETFSDSPSCREERLEGSLAISTTSFDSCLEQTHHFSGNRRSGYNSRLKVVKEKSRDSLSKSKPGASRHLIATKSSDGQITNFMDREPQSQVVSPVEMTRHLHPLKRQSRTKVKQQTASVAPKTYHLRSGNSREPTPAVGIRQVQQPPSCGSNCDQSFFGKESGMSVHIEVGTQVEGNIGQSCSAVLETSADTVLPRPVPNRSSLTTLQPQTPEESPGKVEKPTEPSPEPSCEIIHKRQSSAAVSENDGAQSQAAPQAGWNGEIIEPCVLVKEHPDLPSLERIPGSSSQQSHDKEPNFIFGNRNATARLGESCEFSFGLNWVYSDDEDSDHGDQYC